MNNPEFTKYERDFAGDVVAAEDFDYLYQSLDKVGSVEGVGITYTADEIKSTIEPFREALQNGPVPYPDSPAWTQITDTDEIKILKSKVSELFSKEYDQAVGRWVAAATSFDDLYTVLDTTTVRFGLKGYVEEIQAKAKESGAMPDEATFAKIAENTALTDKVKELISAGI